MSELICWLKAIGMMAGVLVCAGLVIWGIVSIAKRTDRYIDEKMQEDGWNWVAISFAVFFGSVAIAVVCFLCTFLYEGTATFKSWICQ